MEAEIIAPQVGSQEDFINHEADIVFYGGAAGSGKSHAILMDVLKYIEDPDFYGVYFRQNTTQLDGSLWPEAKRMYAPFGVKVREKDKTIEFQSGAKLKFSYMELDKHADFHQGIQYSAIYWDEFTHFSEYQFHYLRSRMRSRAKNKSFMKCSMNPDRDHFVFDWVEPYLYKEDQYDEAGLPIEEMRAGCPDRKLCSLPRYFVMLGNDMHSDWSYDKLKAQFPNQSPKMYTFIAGTIDDNPILDVIEPAYREMLESLPRVNKQRLRYGNWFARPEGSGYFRRDWCEIIPQAPRTAVRCRAWDFASTVPSDVNPNPDWTAGVRMSKDKGGTYYVEHVERFRDRPQGVEAKVLELGLQDGSDVAIAVPQDPGSAGKSQCTQIIRALCEQGNSARAKPTHANKVTRFSPFSAACEAGLVKIVRGSWNDKYFSELEAFTGDGKTKDDQCDASSDAFITLAEKKFMPAFVPVNITCANQFSQ